MTQKIYCIHIHNFCITLPNPKWDIGLEKTTQSKHSTVYNYITDIYLMKTNKASTSYLTSYNTNKVENKQQKQQQQNTTVPPRSYCYIKSLKTTTNKIPLRINLVPCSSMGHTGTSSNALTPPQLQGSYLGPFKPVKQEHTEPLLPAATFPCHILHHHSILTAYISICSLDL